MRRDNKPTRDRRLLWGTLILVLIIAIVILHLSGVVGPGSH